MSDVCTRHIRSATCSSLALLLASCATDSIRDDDYRELFAHARAEIELGPGRQAPAPRRFRHALEVGANAVDGLNATDSASVQLERYRLLEGTVAWKPTLHFGESAALSGLAGLAYDDYEIDATATLTGAAISAAGGNLTRSAADTHGPGAWLGVEARLAWHLLGLYGRASQAAHLFGQSQMAELGVEVHVHDQLTLQAAYRWWNVDIEDLVFVSELSLHVEGITVGGVVRF